MRRFFRAGLVAGGLSAAIASALPAVAGAESAETLDFFGFRLDGAFVERGADGSLDCAPGSELLAMSFSGEIEEFFDGLLFLRDAEIRVRTRGDASPERRRVVYPLDSADGVGLWMSTDEPENTVLESSFWRWVCGGLDCHGSGRGWITIEPADGGDLLLTRFEWRRFSSDPAAEALAGGEQGTVLMGFCPDLRVRGQFGP